MPNWGCLPLPRRGCQHFRQRGASASHAPSKTRPHEARPPGTLSTYDATSTRALLVVFHAPHENQNTLYCCFVAGIKFGHLCAHILSRTTCPMQGTDDWSTEGLSIRNTRASQRYRRLASASLRRPHSCCWERGSIMGTSMRIIMRQLEKATTSTTPTHSVCCTVLCNDNSCHPDGRICVCSKPLGSFDWGP